MCWKRHNLIRFAKAIATLGVVGCAGPNANPSSTTSPYGRNDVVYVGMSFETADVMLKRYGGATMYQVLLPPESRRLGMDLHYYNLSSGRVMEIVSAPATAGRVVHSIRVSTYEPMSWNSKIDPERDKFFNSFRRLDEYRLDKPPG